MAILHLLKTKTKLGCPPRSQVIIERYTNVASMVEGIYVHAFRKKKRVEEELPSFSMLVMKCSAASPILKHCAKHGRRIMSILWQP